MIGLSDSQLEVVMENAEALAEDKCQAFLARVAAVLQKRDQINDDDVSAAVQLALRGLIHASPVWKEWRRNSLPSHEDGEEFDSRPSGLSVALTTACGRHLLSAWWMNLRFKLSGRRQTAKIGSVVRTQG
jgi:hypothetical protein